MLVDRDAQPLGGLGESVVDIDHEVDRLERLAHLGGELAPARRVGAVDLGEHGRKHRRAGRHLHHLERRPLAKRQVGEAVADVERDRVAGAGAIALADEIDREVALLRLVAQIIVAHETVEIERRRRAGVGLDRGQLGKVLQSLGRSHQRAVGLLEARALRQIDDDLDFGFVVEGQQFDGDVLGHEQDTHRRRRQPDRHEEDSRTPAPLQQWARQGRIQSTERADVVDVIGAFGGLGVASAR